MSVGRITGRPATGTVEWRRNPKTRAIHWHARIMLATGKRSPWIPLDPAIPQADEQAARAGAKVLSDKARELGLTTPGTRETVADWFRRFHEHKEGRGLSSVADMRGRAAKWILPGIAHKEMRAVTREDVEDIVRRLDRAVVAWQKADGERADGRISPSTAANVWGDVVHAFDEAVRCKEASLRVLEVSPALGVRGPDTGIDREGPILYSDEILALLRGKAIDEGEKDVPLYRRRVYAMAIYTMARRSEIQALTAADVDLAHATITVSKQADQGSRFLVKKTKTKRSRTIDIEPHLLPLVKHLVKHPEGRDGGRLIRMPPPEDCAELLRKDLWTVGVRRPELHSADSTRTPMVFHCLRDTGLTHMAVRGDSPIVIQWRGGHTDFKTTQGYIQRGRVEARRIGKPLPPLPREVLPSKATRAGGTGTPSKGSPKRSKGSATTSATGRMRAEFARDSSYLVATPTGIEESQIHEDSSGLAEDDVEKTRTETGSRRPAPRPRRPVHVEAKPATDAELERAIVDAVTAGAIEVARVLAVSLEERRHARTGKVIDMTTRFPRGN